jgi:hypothetical protein
MAKNIASIFTGGNQRMHQAQFKTGFLRQCIRSLIESLKT